MERVLGIGGCFLRAAMLVQLRSQGADAADETRDLAGVGRFGWVTDPEGNRVELWEPA